MIIRYRKDEKNSYTKISNKMLNDNTISLEARGLLTFLLSKPDDWQVYATDLAKTFKKDQGTIARILKELIKSKYIQREKEISVEDMQKIVDANEKLVKDLKDGNK